VVTVDPDAPSKESAKPGKYWLHLLVINNNDVVVPYNPPSPPKKSGKHRYIFYLFKQQNKFNDPKDLIISTKKNDKIERKNFDLEEFKNKNNLMEVDNLMFETENE